MALTKTQVSQLYVSIFNRASEGTGNTFWQNEASATTAANAMLATTDAATYFGTSLDTNQAFIEHIYLNTLNKTYAQDTAGVDYWVSLLTNGATRGEVVGGLVSAATDTANAGTAQDQFNNRVTVSDYMADTVSAAPSDYATSTSFVTSANPTGALTVDETSASVTTAQTTLFDAANPGSTLTLTTATTDIVTGTSGSDTLNADATNYQTGDLIVDTSSADSDTLNLALTATNAATPTVSGFENINVNVTSFAAVTVAADNIRGGTITYNQLQTAGNTGATINNVLGANSTNVTAGTGITGTLAVDLASGGSTINGGSATIVNVTDANAGATASGVTTITANSASTISATNIDLDGTTINAGRAGTTASQTVINLDGTGVATDAVTINANGVVDLDLNSADETEILTLSGNGAAATFNFDAADAPESITFTGTQSVTIAGTAAQFTGETIADSTTAGTTTLSIGTAGVLDIDTNVDVDVVLLNVNMAGNQIDVATGETLTVAVTDAVGFDVNAATATATTNSVSIIVDDQLAAVNTINLGTVDITNIKNVALTANDNITSTAGSYGATAVVTLDGAGAVSFTSTAASLNASALTGALTTTASANLTTITGGSAADTFTMYAGAMTLDGGAGTDTLTTDATLDLTTAAVAFTNFETIMMDSANDGTETVTIFGSDVDAASYIVKSGGTTNKDTLKIELDTVSVNAGSLVVDTTTALVDFDLTAVAALASTITGTNGVDSVTNEGVGAVTMNAGAGDDLVDVSGGSAAHNINGGTGADTLTGGAGAETLSGDAGNDTLIGGGAIDTLTGGEGADEITGGAGNDVISLTETTAAIDNIIFTGGATTAAVVTANGTDAITGFGSTDTIEATALGDGTTLIAGLVSVTTADAQGAMTDDKIYVITTDGTAANLTTAGTATLSTADLTATTLTNVAAYLSERFTTTNDVDQENVIAINFGDNAYIYHVDTLAAGTTAIAAAEITLVGTVDANVAAANFVDA